MKKIVEIKAWNTNVTITYRFIGKEIFIQCNNLQYAIQLMAQLKSKGATIEQRRNWLRCNIFGENKTANLGSYYVDLDKDTDDEVQEKLVEFWKGILKQMKMEYKIKEYESN